MVGINPGGKRVGADRGGDRGVFDLPQREPHSRQRAPLFTHPFATLVAVSCHTAGLLGLGRIALVISALIPCPPPPLH